jgi:hypothetical protein
MCDEVCGGFDEGEGEGHAKTQISYKRCGGGCMSQEKQGDCGAQI